MKPFSERELRELERLIPTNVWAVTVDVETYRRLIEVARLVARTAKQDAEPEHSERGAA